MKIIKVIFRITGFLSIGLALLAFASDYLPVDGLQIGQSSATDESRQYIKIVPSEGIDFGFVGVCFLIAGATILVLSHLLSKSQPSKNT